MSYNLLDDKWLKVVNIDRELETISLLDLANNPDKYIKLSFPFPGHNLAVLRFLISLIYAFNHPENIDSWFGMYEDNPFQPVDKFDSLVRPYLDLMNKDYPFMQVKSTDLTNKCIITSISCRKRVYILSAQKCKCKNRDRCSSYYIIKCSFLNTKNGRSWLS
jgi:hypothetical protein